MTQRNYIEARTITDAIRRSNGSNLALKSKTSGFNLIQQIKSGQTLLIGEGNLSFTRSLITYHNVRKTSLTVTTYESVLESNNRAYKNLIWLKEKGVKVLQGVDATNLKKHFEVQKFTTIVFQFPHTGSRKPVSGQNPNHALVKQFLKSAAPLISNGGMVCISHVNSPHYMGAFQFELAAKLSNFHPPESYRFCRSWFPSYTHEMTNTPSSAIRNHRNLLTSVFRPE